MHTKCPQCGFKSALRTDTHFHTCSQCGTTFRQYGSADVLVQYLPHVTNNVIPLGLLKNALDLSGTDVPNGTLDCQFAYHPFWYVECADDTTIFRQASPLPYDFVQSFSPPPANFEPCSAISSFPPPASGPEQLLNEIPDRVSSLRLLYIPLYQIRFAIAGEECFATIVGGSWQLYLSNLPESSSIHVPRNRIFFLATYVLILFAIGCLSPNLWWRTALMLTVLVAGWFVDKKGNGVSD